MENLFAEEKTERRKKVSEMWYSLDSRSMPEVQILVKDSLQESAGS